MGSHLSKGQPPPRFFFKGASMETIEIADLEKWLQDKKQYKPKRVLLDIINQLIDEIKRRNTNDSTRV